MVTRLGAQYRGLLQRYSVHKDLIAKCNIRSFADVDGCHENTSAQFYMQAQHNNDSGADTPTACTVLQLGQGYLPAVT